jgi:epoxyqueuosine reductase
MSLIHEIIKRELIPSGNYVFGFAGINGLIDNKYSDFKYGISIGRRLDDGIINEIVLGPTLAYYHYYRQINLELSVVAGKIKTGLNHHGINAVVIEPTVPVNDKQGKEFMQNLTVDVSHKMVATRAGLGWIGKTDLLISKAFGPRLRLVSLLISQKPKSVAKPVEKSLCGNCRICVDTCPAQAASGHLWKAGVHRDTFFNARKCRDKCGELARQILHTDIRICGICVAVCPIRYATGKDASTRK